MLVIPGLGFVISRFVVALVLWFSFRFVLVFVFVACGLWCFGLMFCGCCFAVGF